MTKKKVKSENSEPWSPFWTFIISKRLLIIGLFFMNSWRLATVKKSKMFNWIAIVLWFDSSWSWNRKTRWKQIKRNYCINIRSITYFGDFFFFFFLLTFKTWSQSHFHRLISAFKTFGPLKIHANCAKDSIELLCFYIEIENSALAWARSSERNSLANSINNATNAFTLSRY